MGKLLEHRGNKLLVLVLLGLLAFFALAGCGGGETTGEKSGETGNEKETKLSGTIEIDGSSTVYPITEAVAEEFMRENGDVMVTVGISGTGGGFKRFAVGETDISDASRPIKDSEAEQAKANGIEFLELPVAYDGITVVVNPQNDWVDYLTVEELNKLWMPESKVTKWSDIRAGWPDEKIRLYGPGTDSGTFDYFTAEINGEDGASRSDYTASEDDNVLVQGVAGDKYALGYFGYAYYAENSGAVKHVSIDGGNGPVEPNMETINNGKYRPLSRPIFIYLSKKSLEKPQVKAFAEFFMETAPQLVEEVGYIPLPDKFYKDNMAKLN